MMKYLLCLFLIIINVRFNSSINKRQKIHQTNSLLTDNHVTNTVCLNVEHTLRAKHKSCFLRPDTGPCRADIIQYYYDIKLGKCYRFFWGGCQGNGNRFETKEECYDRCFVNGSISNDNIPNYCSLAFDYGTCFGYYYRWTWDKITKSCKRRLYSGCGGNQNNFETREKCYANCLYAKRDPMKSFKQYTTCVPYDVLGL